nr:hypothetical protein [Tanacetum cinerariifolium]
MPAGTVLPSATGCSEIVVTDNGQVAEQLRLVRNQFTSITMLPELSNLEEATAIIQAKLQETSMHSFLAREEGEVSELDPNTRRRVGND